MRNLREVGTLDILVTHKDFSSEDKNISDQIEYIEKNYIKKEEKKNGDIIFTVKTYEIDESIKANKED